MAWFSELIKHIKASIALLTASFLTSGILLIGPSYFPLVLEKLEGQWKITAAGIFIFSATMIIFWVIPKTIILIKKTWKRIIISITSKKLSTNEIDIIAILSKYADEPLNLRTIDYDKAGISKLEILAVSQSLSEKGLVEINSFEENLISLSSSGRKKAIDLIINKNA